MAQHVSKLLLEGHELKKQETRIPFAEAKRILPISAFREYHLIEADIESEYQKYQEFFSRARTKNSRKETLCNHINKLEDAFLWAKNARINALNLEKNKKQSAPPLKRYLPTLEDVIRALLLGFLGSGLLAGLLLAIGAVSPLIALAIFVAGLPVFFYCYFEATVKLIMTYGCVVALCFSLAFIMNLGVAVLIGLGILTLLGLIDYLFFALSQNTKFNSLLYEFSILGHNICNLTAGCSP